MTKPKTTRTTSGKSFIEAYKKWALKFWNSKEHKRGMAMLRMAEYEDPRWIVKWDNTKELLASRTKSGKSKTVSSQGVKFRYKLK